MGKYIQYPFSVGGGIEEFAVDLQFSTADGNLSVGLISPYGFNSYYPVTCSNEKMPYCQAVIERDSSRFGQDLPKLLADNGLGRIIGESQSPGLRGYTVFEFYPEALREIDPKVFAEYERANSFQQKSPISYEKQNIKGVEWLVAIQNSNGEKTRLAASAIGNPDAPVIVTPEGKSYVVFAQGDSPQSYETMEEAISHGNKLIRALPEHERDVYLVHPSGREGIYQIEGEDLAIVAYATQSFPGQITVQLLETDGLLDERSVFGDDVVFDEELSSTYSLDGSMSIEDCVQRVAEQLLVKDNPEIAFAAPYNHPMVTIGDYREAMKNAPDRTASLDDLIRDAREKTQLEDSNNSRRPSELDISGSGHTQTNTAKECKAMKYKLEVEVDNDAIEESGLDAVNYIHQEMGWVSDSGIRLVNLEEITEHLPPQREAGIMANSDAKDEQAIDHPLDDLVKEAKDRLKNRETPSENKDKKPPEPER